MRLNSKYRNRLHGGVPELNTSALPDLIFTVLFFFMIVTHMRQTDIKVQVTTPEGREVQKLQKKYATTYLYVGTDHSGKPQVQLNDKLVAFENLATAIHAERMALPHEERSNHTVSVKADRHTPLRVIAQVKEALREANALQVNFSARQTSAADKPESR